MSGEFEDREQETLGELPQPIERERQENYPPSTPRVPPHGGMVNMSPAQLPVDVALQGEKLRASAGDKSRLGSPVIPASVTSVYDSRPINGRDWRVTSYPTVTLPQGEATVNIAATYTVPEGFVSVWRRFLFQTVIGINVPPDDLVGGIATFFPKISLFVDNVVVPDYGDLQYGPNGMTTEDDTFILAQAGQTLKLQAVVTLDWTSLYSQAGAVPFQMLMYGQNLLSTGKPLPFEIATQIKSGSNREGA